MDTSVKLQNMLSYSKIPLVVLGSILALYAAVWIGIILIKKFYKGRPKRTAPVKVKPVSHREKYLRELEKIKNDLENGSLGVRGAYQKMSRCIRRFVHEATGKNVESFVLEDIRREGMQELAELVEEYYAPEFAREAEGDFLVSYEKTKRVIEAWN